jgi:CheY-like chemotaxis protein
MAEEEPKKILLVDDDTSLLTTLSDFLGFEGYEVVTADSGEQGLKRLAKMVPDLIILDMSMPGMGGVGFLKEISSETGKPKYPVLVLTARANMAEFFSDVDVDGFVAKPCEPNDLLMEVARILFLRSGTAGGEAAPAPVQKKKVLIGEDDGGISQRLANAFAGAGWVVNAASKGPEVMERAIVERPDVIVIKLVMAGMNGDAVAQMLSEMPNTKGIPVVLYDDSDAKVPETKFTEAGIGIKKFIRGNSSDALMKAAASLVGG